MSKMNHVLCDIILKASPDSVSQLRHQVTSESYSFKIFPDETGPNSYRFIKPLHFPLMSPERLRREGWLRKVSQFRKELLKCLSSSIKWLSRQKLRKKRYPSIDDVFHLEVGGTHKTHLPWTTVSNTPS